MAKDPLPQLLQAWDQEKLSLEQAIGQLFQHLQELYERLGMLEKKVHQQSTEQKNG